MEIRTLRGETAFYLACYNLIENPASDDARCIRALYHAGCDINLKTNVGYAPIQLAALFGHTPLVAWLLDKNVDLNLKPSPRLLAEQYGSFASIKITILLPIFDL